MTDGSGGGLGCGLRTPVSPLPARMSLTFSPLLQVSAPRIMELSISQRVGNHAGEACLRPTLVAFTHHPLPCLFLLLLAEVF